MNDLEYEQKILCNLIYTPQAIQTCIDSNLSEESFKYPEPKWIFRIAIWYYKQYRELLQGDSLQSILQQSKTISEPLKKQILVMFEVIKKFQPVSNFTLFLGEFTQYYKGTLYKQAVHRSLDLYEGKKLDQAMLALKADLMGIDKKFINGENSGGFLSDDLSGFFEYYKDKQAHPEKYRGIMTGFPSFDRATSGLQNGTVTIVFGVPKSAKSVLMVNIVRNVMNQGKRVYYHVNEGGKKLVHQRLIACDKGIPYNPLRNCQLTPADEIRLKEYIEVTKTNNRAFIDSVEPARSTASYIDNKIRELSALTPINLAIVDHLGLMSSEASSSEPDWKRIAHIAIELKSVAMIHNIPIIVVTHTNREGAKSKNKDTYQMEEISNSYDSLKHVDLICSWKIRDREVFKATHIGTGILAIGGARDSEESVVELHVNTNMMKIEELMVKVGH